MGRVAAQARNSSWVVMMLVKYYLSAAQQWQRQHLQQQHVFLAFLARLLSQRIVEFIVDIKIMSLYFDLSTVTRTSDLLMRSLTELT